MIDSLAQSTLIGYHTGGSVEDMEDTTRTVLSCYQQPRELWWRDENGYLNSLNPRSRGSSLLEELPTYLINAEGTVGP